MGQVSALRAVLSLTRIGPGRHVLAALLSSRQEPERLARTFADFCTIAHLFLPSVAEDV